MKGRQKLPSYRLHKASGQAVVTLSRRDFYLGLHGTQVSRDAYDRVVAEWLANGRQLPRGGQDRPSLTATQVLLAYWKHAQTYYVKNGEPSPEQFHLKTVIRTVRRLYGRENAEDFGPLRTMRYHRITTSAVEDRGVA